MAWHTLMAKLFVHELQFFFRRQVWEWLHYLRYLIFRIAGGVVVLLAVDTTRGICEALFTAELSPR